MNNISEHMKTLKGLLAATFLLCLPLSALQAQVVKKKNDKGNRYLSIMHTH